jgi:hypothetical protein
MSLRYLEFVAETKDDRKIASYQSKSYVYLLKNTAVAVNLCLAQDKTYKRQRSMSQSWVCNGYKNCSAGAERLMVVVRQIEKCLW